MKIQVDFTQTLSYQTVLDLEEDQIEEWKSSGMELAEWIRSDDDIRDDIIDHSVEMDSGGMEDVEVKIRQS